METIHFAPSAAKGLGRKYETDDGYVVRPAKVFECGEYPDKGFSLTEEEADDAIRAFSPVPNNVEHRPSVFDRLLGTTEGLFRKGREIFASVRIPKAVDALLGDSPIPLSAEWTPTPKRYVGTALTVNPRVLSAAAHAFTLTPDFQTFAAEHPSEAAELATVATAPDPATPMNPQQIKEAAWTTFSADPKNAGVTREVFDAALAPPVLARELTPDPELSRLRSEIDVLKKSHEAQAAEFAVQQDERDALRFYRDHIEWYGPAREKEAIADFSLRRRLDRAEAKASGITFSADSGESEVAKLTKEIEGGAKLFALGPNKLSSDSPQFTPAHAVSPLGGLAAHFAAADAEEKK